MTTATQNPYTEVVARGAAWMDAQRPDWRSQINLETFDLADACLCVLGQVFADAAVVAGRDDLTGYDMVTIDRDARWPFENGFALDYDYSVTEEQRYQQWRTLQAAWLDVIEAGR